MEKKENDPKIQKRIQELQENLKIIKEAKFRITDVNLMFIKNELLVPDFMKENTQFGSFDEMLNKSPFKIKNEIEFEFVTENEEWDQFVAMNTMFQGWIEMLKAALLDRAMRKMNY